jgi:uncharacterized protein (TIGR00251 family)
MADRPALPPFVHPIPNGADLRLKVVPGSSRTAIVGPLGDRLKVKVAAPPEAGKANKEVVDVIRRWTGSKDVAVVAGTTNPEKTVRVLGIAADSFDWTNVKR